MNQGWIVFGIICLALLGSTLPLLHKDKSARDTREQEEHPRNEK